MFKPLNVATFQMLGALKNAQNSMSMPSLKGHIDPSLMDLYPHDCVYKVMFLLISWLGY